MIIDSPIISGSSAATGSLNQVGIVSITGSLFVNGITITGNTGSAESASYAGAYTLTSSFQNYTSSTDARIASINASTASLNSYTSSTDVKIASINAFSASILNYTSSTDAKVTALYAFSSSLLSYTSSNNANITSLNSYTSSATARFVGLETATASFSGRVGGLELATASLNTYTSSNTANITSLNSYTSSATARFVGLEAATASLNSYTSSATNRFVGLEAATASLNTYTSSNTANITSLNNYTSSATLRFVGLEAATSSLNTFTSSIAGRVTVIESKYATTGSNTFTGCQYISNTTAPTGFSNTTAAVYTDGGLQVTKDSYFSSSLYIKGNLTVYGTQSVSYITSSALNISTNIITVNTATPSVRFGGLAVYDSGSTGLTGSMLWDSQNNNWLYSNPTGSGNYDSAMVIMGPRNASALGNEQGLNCNYLVLGHGSHHTTSSAIFHDGSTTCLPGAVVGGSTACFSSIICTGNKLVANTATNCTSYLDGSRVGFSRTSDNVVDVVYLGRTNDLGVNGTANIQGYDGIIFRTTGPEVARMCITSTGISTFACQICTPSLIANTITLSTTTADYAATITNVQDSSQGLLIRATDNDAALNILNLQSSVGAVSQTWVDRFTVTKAGNAGIGTSSPCSYASQTLHVNSPSGASTSIKVTNTTTTTGVACGLDILQSNNDTYIYNRSVGLIELGTSNAARLTISSTGIACFSNTVCVGGDLSVISAGSTTALFDGTNPTLTLRRNNNGNASAAINFKGSTAVKWQMGTNQAVGLGFEINEGDATANKFYINPGGIATFACQICVKEAVYVSGTFPGVKLDRAGTTAQSDINWKDAGTSVWSIGTAVKAVGSSLDFYSYSISDNVMKLTQAGIACFSGNVCIGGTLTLGNAGVTNAVINSADGMYLNIDSDGSGSTPEFMFGKGRSGAGSGGTTFMTIANSGCIGINTTSPCALLHISTPSTACILWPAILNNPYNDGITGYGVGLRLQNSSMAGTQEINKWAGIAAIAGGSSGYSNDTDLAFYVGCFILAANCTCPPVEKMRIKSSTGYILTPQNSSTLFGAQTATSAGNGSSLTIKAGGGYGSGCASGDLYLAAGRGASSANSGNIIFGRANSTDIPGVDACWMFICSNGNVGIGTSSPTAPLTVAGTTDLAWSASTSKLQISRSGTVARLQNYDNGSAASLALQWEGGNVGIGTTDPQKLLEVRSGGSSTTPSQIFAGAVVQAMVGGEPQIAFSSNIAPSTGTTTATELTRAGIGFQYISAAQPSEFSIGIQCTNVCNSNVKIWNNAARLTISSTGIATFACQVQTNGGCISINRTDGTPAVLQLGNTSNSYAIQYTCTGGQRLAFINGAPSEFASFFGTGQTCLTGNTYVGKLSVGTDYAGFAANINGTTYIIGGQLYLNVGYKVMNTSDNASIQFSDNTLNVNGSILPISNGTQNLGSSAARWGTVFTSDLDMSNGIGDYTIVEGENDLFLYNNKQNKVYKFVIQEVNPSEATPKMKK